MVVGSQRLLRTCARGAIIRKAALYITRGVRDRQHTQREPCQLWQVRLHSAPPWKQIKIVHRNGTIHVKFSLGRSDKSFRDHARTFHGSSEISYVVRQSHHPSNQLTGPPRYAATTPHCALSSANREACGLLHGWEGLRPKQSAGTQ